MNLAWLELGEGEASCPEIPTGQLGKLLALSFWEDFAILDQMMAYIPTVSWLCATPAPPNTLSTRVHTYMHLACLVLFAVLNPSPGCVGLLCGRNTQDLLNLKLKDL